MKATVIHHSADYDGIFCREIARNFLPDAELIGWDFSDKPMPIPIEGMIYVLDLPVDRVFGFRYDQGKCEPDLLPKGFADRIIWIDHHKSSIETHPEELNGFRIDGVAACRLAWQWFTTASMMMPDQLPDYSGLPDLFTFKDRRVVEPYAVRLAGEYDIWDKRDPDAEVFQFGLRSVDQGADFFEALLQTDDVGKKAVRELLENGRLLQRYQQQNDANTMRRSFVVEFAGVKFLALNTARCNSLTFASRDTPETGHDALMGFYWTGKAWSVSMYHAKHGTSLDLSAIAIKNGGGGHRGACGFITEKFPLYGSPKP